MTVNGQSLQETATPREDIAATPALLEVKNVAKTFVRDDGGRTQAIADVSFSAYPGEIISIVGPSGAGKTTLLRIIAGLLKPDSGSLSFDGKAPTGVPKELSVVFQEYNRSLFPWLTIAGNVEFPLRRLSKQERRTRATDALAEVGLADSMEHYPWQVSGGMQQRAAIARAISTRPRVLLLDEPFASVDAQTRVTLEQLTLSVSRHLGLTTILITHDIDESIVMSNRVVVMSRRPSRVVREIPIELPWPRADLETRAHPQFSEYRREIHDLIGSASA